jgi:hypothetical protein
MYVLTVDTGRYSDAETHVVGVFDTIEAMVAAKEVRKCSVPDDSFWDAWEVPQANTYFAPGSLEFERIMTQRELDVVAEQVQVDNLARQKLVDAEQERIRVAERRRSDFRATILASSSLALSPAAPIMVLEHLVDMSADVELVLKGATSPDPHHQNRLPSLMRRQDWYAQNSAVMRSKLQDTGDIAAFDAITAASRNALEGAGSSSPDTVST